MPRTPSAFPFSGRLRRRAINPTPPKRVKAWEDGPLRPEVMYPVVEHTRTDCAARNHNRSRAPHHRTQKSAKKRTVFILRPTNVRIWHKAVFKVGPVAGPKPNAIGSSKNASDPVGIPLFGAPQAPGDKPNHRERPTTGHKRAPKSALYLSYVPPTYEYGTRPCLRWVLSQGRSPTR